MFCQIAIFLGFFVGLLLRTASNRDYVPFLWNIYDADPQGRRLVEADDCGAFVPHSSAQKNLRWDSGWANVKAVSSYSL